MSEPETKTHSFTDFDLFYKSLTYPRLYRLPDIKIYLRYNVIHKLQLQRHLSESEVKKLQSEAEKINVTIKIFCPEIDPKATGYASFHCVAEAHFPAPRLR